MSERLDPMQLPWLAATRRRPLCDVPWLGNVTVAEDGWVQFCCHSPARVGNVGERGFPEIWNGAEMQRIRRTLANGQFPPECCTSSCPIHRGDPTHFIRKRIDRLSVGWPGQSAPRCEGGLVVPGRLRRGELLTVDLRFEASPAAVVIDVVLAITPPGGPTRFLPELTPVPQPHSAGWTVGGPTPSLRRLLEAVVPPETPQGHHTVHAAAFAAGASPLAGSLCGWAAEVAVEIAP